MKRMLKTATVFVIILSLLLSSFIFTATAEDATALYGRDALGKMSNSASLLYAYDEIVKGVENSSSSQPISVRDASRAITVAELKTVIVAVFSDHPELFWIKKEWSYNCETATEKVNTVKVAYYMENSELANAKAELDKAVGEMTRGLEGKSDYEKAKILHDRISVNTDYVHDGYHQTAYGALVDKQAVCAGYATAYQLLLNKVGISAWTISGDSVNPNTSTTVKHEWNLVNIDGKNYLTDITWNDCGSKVDDISYLFFCVTTDQMKTTHSAQPFFAQNLPECTATDANYFVKNNAVYSSFDADKLAQQFKKDGLTARIYVSGDANAFLEAFVSNIQTVINKSGASFAVSYSYKITGNEICLTLKCNCEHKNVNKEYDGEFHWETCSKCSTRLNRDIHRYSGSSTKCTACEYNYGAAVQAKYTLTYNANGGSGAPAAQSGASVYTVSSAKPVRNGYIFLGWSENSSATMPSYTSGSSISLSSDTVLYAVWKANSPADVSVKVEINNNPEETTLNYGDVLKLTAVYVKPADATVCWYVNGTQQGSGEKFEYEALADAEIEVKLVNSAKEPLTDGNGNEISDSESVKVKDGFFQKIISFFKNLFRIDRSVNQ